MIIKDKNSNTLVKLFKGSASAIISESQDYKDLKYYGFTLQLKGLNPYSYISDYKSKISSIAKELGCCRQTVINRIECSINRGFAYLEGDTLRLLSNTEIRKRYAVKTTKKSLNYIYVKLQDVPDAVKSQALTDSIKYQEKASKKKSNKSAAKDNEPRSQLTYRELIKRTPNIKLHCVDTTLLSQQKTAQLLGYKSKASGYRALKRLSTAKFLEIESNVIQITRDEFNFYKSISPAKVLIKGRGKDAKFFFCNANTVKIAQREVVLPHIELKYSVTSSIFLDNY